MIPHTQKTEWYKRILHELGIKPRFPGTNERACVATVKIPPGPSRFCMKAPKHAIRRLRPSDYDELLSVWEMAGLPARPKGRDSSKELTRQMGLGTSIYLKVVVNEGSKEKIVAVVLGTHDGRKGWINRLAVLPEYRRQGLGRRLVVELEKRFRRMGFEIYCGLIETYNDVSMNFFAKLGYVRHEDIIYYSKRKSDGT